MGEVELFYLDLADTVQVNNVFSDIFILFVQSVVNKKKEDV